MKRLPQTIFMLFLIVTFLKAQEIPKTEFNEIDKFAKQSETERIVRRSFSPQTTQKDSGLFEYMLENEFLSLSDFAWNVGIADVDYDGNNELVIGSENYLEVRKYQNNEYQLFWSKHYPQQNFTACFAIGDIDNDSLNEIVLASMNDPVTDDTLRILKFNAQTSEFEQISWTTMGDNVGFWGVAIGNLDNDLINEIAVGADSQGIRVYSFENNVLNLEWEYTTARFPYSLAIGDVDNDGSKEIVTDGIDSLVYILGYDGNNYGLEWQNQIGSYPHRIVIGDIDQDNAKEIILGNDDTNITILSYNQGNYNEESAIQFGGSRNWGIAIGDFVNDTKLEFVRAESSGDSTFAFKSFQANSYNMIGAVPAIGWGVTIGDSDNDGLNELFLHETFSLCRIFSATYQPTAIKKDNSMIPAEFRLSQNYPNPFNPTTSIKYQLSKASNVEVTIYNQLGQPIRTLVNSSQSIGKYQVQWDGKNDKGVKVSSGVYLYRLKTSSFDQTKKMLLLR